MRKSANNFEYISNAAVSICNSDLIPDDAHIVQSPPSSEQSLSTPPSTSQHHNHHHHTVKNLHNHQHHHQQQQQQHHVIVGTNVGGTMSHTATQRASTLPRHQQLHATPTHADVAPRQHGHSNQPNRPQQHPNQRQLVSASLVAAQVLGLYGWRKSCLFVLICALITLIVTNLALTLWILKVMEFSSVSKVNFVNDLIIH